MEFKFKIHTKIQKPIAEVFDAVYNPKKLSGYFTTGGASGPLDEGKSVIWKFADYPGDVPVKVSKVIPNELIAFSWAAGDADLIEQKQSVEKVALPYDTEVELRFESLDASNTLVTITEGNWRETEKGLKSSYGNCMGWTNMVCCLKAYVEYNINLRKGAF
jgi:uncharacterized protein YndB with AHSA1/START domain